MMGHLDEIRDRLNAATPGPWFQGRERDRYENIREVYSEREPSATSHDICTSVWNDNDAEFIANAPTDVARLLNAVQNVLDVHQPVTDELGGQHCAWCLHRDNGSVWYPCPTVRAITTALEADRGRE
jgi:hypothetical protein